MTDLKNPTNGPSSEKISKNGTTSMGRKRHHILDAKSICEIIEKGGQAGVSELTFGDLKLRFHPQSSPRLGEQPLQEQMSVDPEAMGPTSGLGSGDPDTSSSMDPNVLQEIEEAQRMLDDPQAFETQKIDELIGS